ncbi:MAG: CRTAC1 family protein [bacterium]|nr:CRTAC1 family protein [bacterium]
MSQSVQARSTVVILAMVLCSCGPTAQSQVESATATGAETSAPEESGIFADVTVEAGLDFRHFNGMTGELYFAEMNGAGAGLFDFDNDGDLDAYLVQGAHLGDSDDDSGESLTDRLFRNELDPGAPAGTVPGFTDVTEVSGLSAERYGMGVTAGDFDNDGWTDLYVTNLGANQLLRNNRDGTLSDVTARAGVGDEAWSVSATFVDFDRDGRLDLYVTNYVDFSLANHRVCPAPGGSPDYCGPLAFAFVSDRLYRNLGDGTFKDVSASGGLRAVSAAGMGAVSGDFDGDGWPDFYVANDQMENHLWLNQGDGTFENQALLTATAFNESGAPEASMGVTAGDYDNDGDEDLFLTHLRRETNTLYRNDGSGLFVDATRASGLGSPSWRHTSFGTAWLDFDNDGWLDLLTVSGAVRILEDLARLDDPHPLHQPNQLFHGIQGGRFEEVSDRAGPAFCLSEVTRGAAFGDVDNDGDTDVLITNNEGPARLLLNAVGQNRHWLGLRLLGKEAARDMLGAWVCIERTDGGELCRRARAGGSYASSSDPRVLFGLGDSPAVERAKVVWPSGRSEIFSIEGVDRYLTLREGTGQGGP